MIDLTLDDSGVATLVLDRPAARNALPTEAWWRLAETVAAIPASARVLLVASAVPGIFSAGADLADLARLIDDVPARTAFRMAMAAATEALAGLPVPSIAAVEGACHGAGVALTLACDIVVAGSLAQFAIPPARLVASRDVGALRLLKAIATDPADPAHDSGFEASFASPAFAAGVARYRGKP